MLLTLTDLINEAKRETGLGTSSHAMITARLNDYQSQICGEQDWKWLEKLFSITTVANQESYDLDIQNLDIKSVWMEISDSDKHVPMREVVNPTEWDTINNFYSNSTSDYPYLFHVRLGKLYIYPKVSTAGYTIKVLCTVNPVAMETEDYSTGSIAVTNGDETVTGTGTAWTTYVKAGCKIKINRKWYEVASVTDNTHLELTKKYQGTTESGITTYKTGDAPVLPENYHSILWKMFCEEYYAKNPSGRKADAYSTMVMKARLGLDEVSSAETTTDIWDNDPSTDYYYGLDPYRVYPT